MRYKNIREEELKNKVGADWFKNYDTTEILGNAEAKKALELKTKIDATDKEIDQMVYKLYDLTDEEIVIVENS
jgi:type II restriction/modification system DNA methylase subunit YeeA